MADTPPEGAPPRAPDSPHVDGFAWGLLALLALAGAALVFVTIPDKQLTPFIALASTVAGGGVGTYVGYRWGASKTRVGGAP